MNFAECPYIPVLDDPIQINEVIEGIKESKADKACGINGISPGIFKLLPCNWILRITFILNILFHLGSLPTCWMYSNLLLIFKKGTRLCCGNYGDISINDSLYRIFDKVLYSKLTSWYIPSKEQHRGTYPQRSNIVVHTLKGATSWYIPSKDQHCGTYPQRSNIVVRTLKGATSWYVPSKEQHRGTYPQRSNIVVHTLKGVVHPQRSNIVVRTLKGATLWYVPSKEQHRGTYPQRSNIVVHTLKGATSWYIPSKEQHRGTYPQRSNIVVHTLKGASRLSKEQGLFGSNYYYQTFVRLRQKEGERNYFYCS